jgi:hypothetical protein
MDQAAGAVRVGHVLAGEVDDADVLDPHLVVVVVARRDRVELVAGHPDRDVALGRLEVAALQHGAAHVDDVLAGHPVFHRHGPILVDGGFTVPIVILSRTQSTVFEAARCSGTFSTR